MLHGHRHQALRLPAQKPRGEGDVLVGIFVGKTFDWLGLISGRGIRMTEPGRLLDIYLRDHRAGAVAGRRLAKRLCGENPEPQWAPLQRIAREIEADESTLDIAMRMLGVSEAALKNLVAVAIEKVGRLKPNGRLLGYSPLSRVMEMESLMSGLIAKRRLWVSLRQLAKDGNRSLPGIDFDELEARADDQLITLALLHERAARIAFLAEEEIDSV